jgi:hypothetical protein
MAEAVVFALLGSFILSRTLVPVLAKYLLKGQITGNADYVLHSGESDYRGKGGTAVRFQHRSVSQQEADEKAAAYAVSQSHVNAAQANLERLRALAPFKHVIAPFDGIVTARNTDVGDLINAGAGGKGNELFRVADERQARVYVDVPQIDAGQIKVGLTAQLQLPRTRASWCRPGWRRSRMPLLGALTAGCVDAVRRRLPPRGRRERARAIRPGRR